MPTDELQDLLDLDDENADLIRAAALPFAAMAHLDRDAAIAAYLKRYAIHEPGEALRFLTNHFCGTQDLPDASGVHVLVLAIGGKPWTKRRLTWKALSAGSGLSDSDIITSAGSVFDEWQAVLPGFIFEQAPLAGDDNVDILIRFGGSQLNSSFGTIGNVLASSGFPNSDTQVRVGFDSFESWNKAAFENVLQHELGHSFGVQHCEDPSSIMYPIAQGTHKPIDDLTREAVRQLYGWSPTRRIGVKSARRPGLASDGTTALALFRGAGSIQTLQYSVSAGSQFGPAQQLADRGSSDTPALTTVNGRWVALWKGARADTRLWTSELASVGQHWGPQSLTPYTSASGPAIAAFEGAVVAVWRHELNASVQWGYRGILGGIDSPDWSAAKTIAGATSEAPTLVVAGGVLHLFWQGSNGDQQVWHSTLDPETHHWSPQQPIEFVQRVDWDAGKGRVVTTHAPLLTHLGVSAAALPDNAGIALAIAHTDCAVTLVLRTSAGVWDWTEPFPSGFDSFLGQSLVTVGHQIVAVGLESFDRFEQEIAQADVQI